jgi:hypothetical protein
MLADLLAILARRKPVKKAVQASMDSNMQVSVAIQSKGKSSDAEIHPGAHLH